MKVFVVVGGWWYEGNDEPCAVFSTKKAARDYIASGKVYDGYDGVDIITLDLDSEPSGWQQRDKEAIK